MACRAALDSSTSITFLAGAFSRLSGLGVASSCIPSANVAKLDISPDPMLKVVGELLTDLYCIAVMMAPTASEW